MSSSSTRRSIVLRDLPEGAATPFFLPEIDGPRVRASTRGLTPRDFAERTERSGRRPALTAPSPGVASAAEAANAGALAAAREQAHREGRALGRDEGYAEGRAAGHADGRSEGLAEGQALGEAAGRSKALEALGSLTAALEQLPARWAELEASHDAFARGLAQLVADALSRGTPGEMAERIQSALATLPSPADALVVRLNPSDAALLREADPRLAQSLGASLAADPGIEPGGFFIGSSAAEVDATLATRLALLRKALADVAA